MRSRQGSPARGSLDLVKRARLAGEGWQVALCLSRWLAGVDMHVPEARCEASAAGKGVSVLAAASHPSPLDSVLCRRSLPCSVAAHFRALSPLHSVLCRRSIPCSVAACFRALSPQRRRSLSCSVAAHFHALSPPASVLCRRSLPSRFHISSPLASVPRRCRAASCFCSLPPPAGARAVCARFRVPSAPASSPRSRFPPPLVPFCTASPLASALAPAAAPPPLPLLRRLLAAASATPSACRRLPAPSLPRRAGRGGWPAAEA
jgi:hypothetical protein